ncbi:hypothetical protein [Fundidesulfovibrio magnetotacticus]|uniref:hypothetical protein n=1 Tax=Fundidesulfovibrio magnetotacticus TaxID=2730080 RepID=UPI0015665083|nr:hypothetical protein [Fundidesulfovibrio magnetotacticus]
MKTNTLPFLAFLGVESCLGLVILLKVAPAAIKTGSVLAVAGAIGAAVPWSLVAATGLAVWRFAASRRD